MKLYIFYFRFNAYIFSRKCLLLFDLCVVVLNAYIVFCLLLLQAASPSVLMKKTMTKANKFPCPFSFRYMLVDSEEDKKIHRPFIPKDVSLVFFFFLCECVYTFVRKVAHGCQPAL